MRGRIWITNPHLTVAVALAAVGSLAVGAMGANATPMPYGEVYTGLQTGLIDAAENIIPSFDTAQVAEGVQIFSTTEHSVGPELLLSS